MPQSTVKEDGDRTILPPGRGSELRENSSPNDISFLLKNIGPYPTDRKSEPPDGDGEKPWDDAVLVVINDEIYFIRADITHPSEPPQILRRNGEISVTIPKGYKYMFVNLTDKTIEIEPAVPGSHRVIYDPYLYENKPHVDIDPEKFRKEHPDFYIPEGYVDTLPKWYSVKYTYPDRNLIFIRPGVGISWQVHSMRREHWKVIMGSPIIISGNKVYYDTAPGDEFTHPSEGLHSIINPTSNWVEIEETYKGRFDEEDIIRVFNPNRYGV